MKKLALHWKILIGMLLGVAWAYLSSNMGWSEFTADWINPFGTIFIKTLKFIAIPLVLFSIITGITGLSDISKLGRMGAKTLAAYLLTTVFAVSIGLGIVNLFKPGENIPENQRIENRLRYEKWASEQGYPTVDGQNFTEKYKDIEVGEMAIDEATANAVASKAKTLSDKKKSGPLSFVEDIVPDNLFMSLSNNKLMLQIIFFAMFFGISILLIDRSKVQSVINLCEGANEIFLKMVDVVMQAAPFFVFALMAGKMSEMAGDNPDKLLDIFISLGMYAKDVVLGLAIMIFVIYPTIKILLVNKSVKPKTFFKLYLKFFRDIGAAQTLAFSSSSSAATLPVTMECVSDNMGVDKEISGFVLPIGATVNMDGTSLYQAVAVIFLAQLHYIDLSLGQQMTIVLTATLASIGSAAVPSAGLVMLMVVLESLQLNPAWIAIIFPIDRILDMCRTVVNVTGDATVCTVIAKSEGQLNETKVVH